MIRLLLLEARERLEALWDCSCPDCPSGEQCERCRFLARIDEETA